MILSTFMRKRSLYGFTLLELVVVIVILGVLAAVAVPTFQQVQNKARGAAVQQTLEAVGRDASALYALRVQGTEGGFEQQDFDEALEETASVAFAPEVLAAGKGRSAEYRGRNLFKVAPKESAVNMVSVNIQNGSTMATTRAGLAALVPGVEGWCAWTVITANTLVESHSGPHPERCVGADAYEEVLAEPAAPAATGTVVLSGTSAPNEVTLTWTTLAEAESYNVHQVAPGVETIVSSQKTTTLKIPDLTNGVEYTYVVYPVVGGAEATASNTVKLMPLPILPAVPTGLVATPVSDTEGNATWNVADRAVGYRVYLGGNFVAQVTSPKADLTGLAPNTTYSVQVSSYDEFSQESAPSSPASFRTFLSAPEQPIITKVTDTTTEFKWTPVTGAVAYDVYQDGVKIKRVTSPSDVATGLTPGTDYTFTVTAVDDINRPSKQSPPASAHTAPSTPSPKVTGVTESTVTLEWTASTGATGYRVYVGGAFAAQVTGTTATITGLASNTTYSFQVSAFDAAGNESAPSAPVSARTLLPAPTGLAVTGTTSSSADLTWVGVTGATAYDVYQDGVKVKQVTTLTTTVTGLAASTDYTFTVTAVDDIGRSSAKSSPADAHTYPATPATPTKTGSTTTSIAVSWPAASGATGYRVYVGGAFAAQTTSTSANLTGLAAGTSYSIQVSAYDAKSYESAPSGTLTAWTNPPTPSLKADSVASTSVALSWNSVQSASSYRLYRNGVLLVSPTTTSHIDSTVAAGTAYSYHVVAVGPGGISGNSNTVSVDTPPASPAPTKTGATDTTISISWPAAAGASYYRVYVGGNFYASVTGGVTSATITGLSPATGYNVQVSSVSGANVESAPSPATTMYTTPSAPGTPSRTGSTTSSISLSWNAVYGASSYQVLRNGTVVGTPTGTTYTDSGLCAGCAYGYSLRAVGTGGTSATGGSATYYTLAQAGTPWVTGTSSSGISIGWNSVSSASSYNVYRNGSYLGNTTGTGWSDGGLASGSQYTYTIAAHNPSGLGPQGGGVTGTTQLATPNSPSWLSGSSSSLNVGWNSVSGASYYYVYINGSAYYTTGTSYNFGSLGCATQYRFEVRAYNSVTQSALSGSSYYTTGPCGASVSTGSYTQSSMNVYWSATGASRYEVYRGGTYLGSFTGTSMTDSGLASGTTYTYYVYPYGGTGGVSGPSGSGSGLTKPATPTTTAKSAGSESALAVSWTGVAGASGYYLYRNGSYIGTFSGTSMTNTGLSPITQYGYSVIAYNNSGTSGTSNTSYWWTQSAAPTGLSATCVGSGYARITYNNISNNRGYQIRRFRSSDSFEEARGNVSQDTTVVDQQGLHKEGHYWWVIGYNPTNELGRAGATNNVGWYPYQPYC